ncbi:mechanosensitive ion channel family protein [Halarcobacter anaerophilus]|jgi:small conductance mechanosensitive channel|uniref:Mechanosensitive ion channel protein MscS n=1 Tax=Halarcobacter anaerophilus TaxID=877500 RepID=A0A4Q0XXN5_9BACT|nr:mechanosensitive ion channel domain-containing protein [Halarcobacter anaerophilus]QDF28064.1 small conductance mechanosensitive channel protein [Halarcobacter anaerophilus]RXJ62410.1 mechanosensitive ion channel protein MscS [Halarcobacter anaerophilus]
MNSVETVSDMIGLYALNVAIAIVIFVVGKWLARKIADFANKMMLKNSKVDATLANFLDDIIYYVLIVIVVLTALKQLGVDTTSFFAILGAAGLAIGLALKDSLGNLASGVMIILFRPFNVGDFINAAGVTGKVEEVSIFNTILITPDNQKIIVPNGSISSGSITNINAKPERRVDLLVGISYDDDIKKAKNILTSLVEADERVLKDKGITVAVSELADSSVNFVVRAWVKTADYWDVKFDLTENVKVTFDKEGITIPYPQQDVHHHNND